MAEKSSTKKQRVKKTRATRPPARRDDQMSHAQGAPDRLADLPAQKNAFPARLGAILQMQRQLGNNYVQRQIGQDQDENKRISTKGLRLKMELEGHPYSLAIQREDEAGEEAEAEKSPTANVSIKLNKPKVNRIPEKKVQEKHNKSNIAGWTTPAINVGVPSLKKYEIKIVITLDFEMDLAKEYKGTRGQVLRDHEDVHMTIAEKVAQEYVADPLKEEFESWSEFNDANRADILPKVDEKLKEFKTEEGLAAQAFDDIDYPRMEEAYYGAATSLADLASGSAEVKSMVEAMDAFNEGAKDAAGDAETLGGLTQAIVEGQGALSEANLARLQYNPEFKKKVAKAQGIVAKLSKKGDELGEEVKGKLEEVSPALEKFTWEPDI